MDPITLPADDAENATAAAEIDTASAPVEVTAEQAQPSQAETPQAQTQAPAPAEKPEPFWYRKALREKEEANKALQRRIDEIEQRVQSTQTAPQNLSPEELFARQESVLNIRLSERFARQTHGSLFEEARDWLATRPDIEVWAQQQDDPWDAAINLYKREKLAAEIGDDPAAYRARIEAEIRAQYEQQPAAQQPAGMTTPRLPQSAAATRSAPPRDPGTGQFSGFRNKF